MQFLASENLNHLGPDNLQLGQSADLLPLVLSTCQKPTTGSNNDTLNADLSGLPTVEEPSRIEPAVVGGTFRTNNMKQVNFQLKDTSFDSGQVDLQKGPSPKPLDESVPKVKSHLLKSSTFVNKKPKLIIKSPSIISENAKELSQLFFNTMGKSQPKAVMDLSDYSEDFSSDSDQKNDPK